MHRDPFYSHGQRCELHRDRFKDCCWEREAVKGAMEESSGEVEVEEEMLIGPHLK